MASSVGLPAMFSSMPPPLVFPALTEHRSTVVIVHGLGDSGHGYTPIVRGWHEGGLFQDTKFILPSAPSIPVTSAGGRSTPAWFDISGARGPHVTFDDLTAQPQDEAGLLHSRDYLVNLIEQEVNTTSVPNSQVILGGFSQGAVMSLLTGVTSGLRLGGIFCLSGYLALAEAIQKGDDAKFKRATDTTLPILMSIGDKDPVINPEWAHKSAGIVKDLGYDVDLTVVPGLGHSINQAVLRNVEAFITRIQNSGANQHDEL
ncbi:hypothetical protein N0V93_005261 [Gnomoniopsis smithogilvyi]|uniref:Acyl-protein thioesterase 1 n=1 Tax=Gnomoniopsis smithogilvyi TaxID=1191159 RepID=A0A9W8YSK5_9PEZI|nr:hypothetical protein N0V93_005261 [Gnomoniopsis smithogilvyi]